MTRSKNQQVEKGRKLEDDWLLSSCLTRVATTTAVATTTRVTVAWLRSD